MHKLVTAIQTRFEVRLVILLVLSSALVFGLLIAYAPPEVRSMLGLKAARLFGTCLIPLGIAAVAGWLTYSRWVFLWVAIPLVTVVLMFQLLVDNY